MKDLLDAAIAAAHAAGNLQREHFGQVKHVNEMQQYDIKLELDVRCQTLITEMLLPQFPDHAVLGDEGDPGGNGPVERIVAPIAGPDDYLSRLTALLVHTRRRR